MKFATIFTIVFFIASPTAFATSDAEIDEIVYKALEIYDANVNGVLEREEVAKLLNDACAEFGADEPTDDQIDMVISTVDENNNGKVDFEELYQIIAPILRQS